MKTIIDVHYTWVGPPHDQDHDVEGPRSLLAKLKNTSKTTYHCYFWCLDRYVKSFTKKLAMLKLSITVRSIEGFLNRCGWTSYRWYYWYGTKEDDAVAHVRDMIEILPVKDTVLWDKGNVNTRDVVNAKNVWSFFLLYTWGGYHFDTGIKADDKKSPSLVKYDTFKAPRSPQDEQVSVAHHKIQGKQFTFTCGGIVGEGAYFFGSENRSNAIHAPRFDVWALYSPRHDHRAFAALSWYYRAWKYLRSKKLGDEAYRQAFRSAVVNAVYTALVHDAKGFCSNAIPKECWWKWGENNDTVPELGVLKVFHGSHRKSNEDRKDMF
ncbi:hypothetical protein WMF27_01055 [Sorangium sp. So ce281]|uniref:hypothetical protein n=1 Tax=unclassified Sorangium TaxID=2621164 RepID=UPI003F5E46C7